MDRQTDRFDDFLAGGGEMGAAMRAHDWSATPLGPPHTWPQRLRSVVNILLTSRFAMWMGWGPDLCFFYNDAYAPTLGSKHGWALGRSSREVWSEIWPDIGPRIEHVLATGNATWDEALLLLLERSGYREETYHTFSYSPLRSDDGAIAGHLCVVSEETDRIIGERRLRTLRELAAGLAAAGTEADVLAASERSLAGNASDLPFALLYLWNEAGDAIALAASSGFAAADAARTAYGVASAGHDWGAASIRAGAQQVEVAGLDARPAPLPSGAWQHKPDRALTVPIARQGQDRPAGFLVAGLNPHRFLDAAYTDFIRLLAGQIASGLANARSYQEERRRAAALAELDRAKTDFFSNVSHEFRTPLTLMLSPLEELLARPAAADDPDRHLLDITHRNALRLLKLVNTLLDFARIEAGRVQARYQPTDVAAFTAELASTFRSATERAGLALVIDTPPLAEPVFLDRGMWEKIVLNLISNAFKFTYDGAITVQTRLSADGAAAELLVRDTGTGIEASQLPLLFDRFHRVEGAGGRSFEGSGIGLALVQELVGLHGGTVRVASTPGLGSTFTVAIPTGRAHLPAERILAAPEPAAPEPAATPARTDAYVREAMSWLGDAAPAAPPSPAPPSPAPPSPAPPAPDLPAPDAVDGAAGRVVLADDNADMRDYVRRLLTAAGFAVTEAADGRAALAAVAATLPDQMLPDLVLADVMMPVLDGFGLLAALRADPATRGIPVILLSARAGEEARLDGLRAGADDYLTKPFNARELVTRIEGNIRLARLRRETEQKALGQKRILERIAAGGRLEDTLAEVALFVERHEPAARAAILRVAPDGRHFLRGIGPSLPDVIHDSIAGLPVAPPFTGSCARAVHDGEPVRLADIAADRTYPASWRELMLAHGLRSVRSTPAFGPDGAPVASCAIFYGQSRDPSPDDPDLIAIATHLVSIAIERSRTEASLRDLLETLEARVEERTAELGAANRQLLEQIAEREQVEATLRQLQRLEAVGQLTSGVAHDFNNLLTVIMGQLTFLARGVSDPAAQRRLGMMETAARRGAGLTAQLLAFSRRQRLDPRPVDLNAAMHGMGEMLRSTLGGTVRLEIMLQPDLWPALVDQTQLELAVLNLAINARDAMPVGGALTIETSNAPLPAARTPHEPGPGDYVCVAVSDTGTGMPPDVLARVFEPFFTTKDVGKGSGLGLAQVHGFAKQSGGGVRIDTRAGEGTSVKVYFPRSVSRDAGTAPAAAAAAVPYVPRERHLLLVDDDGDVREVTRQMLADLGYVVLEAGSGGAALELLDRETAIDMALIDFAMPGMNGAELARQIEARRPGLPLAFVTGYADTRAMAAIGDRPVVMKPFMPDQLAATVRQAMEAATPPANVVANVMPMGRRAPT